MRFKLLLSLVLMLAALSGNAVIAAGDYVLLVHAPEGQTVAKDAALALIRGERRNWEGGIDARVILPARDSAHYEPLAKRLFGLSGKGMERQWFRLVFAGQVNPPVYIDNDAEVLAYILEHPGSIGVADADAVSIPNDLVVIAF